MIANRLERFSVLYLGLLTLAVLMAPQLAQAQWQATAGAQSHDLGRQAMAFLPSEMWIHAGDNVTWKFATDESHTVTFLTAGQIRPAIAAGCPGFAPGTGTFDGSTCLTSAAYVKGQTFTVTFPVVGNFKLVCLAHKDMTATIHVLDLSMALPHSQAFYDERGEEEPVDVDGARHAVINSTTDSVHSGSIASAPQERTGLAQAPLGITRFRVTFTKAGTYPYICALHDQLGMKGTVIVLP